MLPFVDRDAGCALPGTSCIAHCFYNYAGITRPVRVGGCNCKGLFTRERTPKLAAHYFKERWADKGPNDPM